MVCALELLAGGIVLALCAHALEVVDVVLPAVLGLVAIGEAGVEAGGLQLGVLDGLLDRLGGLDLLDLGGRDLGHLEEIYPRRAVGN